MSQFDDKELMKVLAHDLRTPISSVRSFIDLSMHAGDVNDRQRHLLERAIQGLGRMELLIDDVMQLSLAADKKALKFEAVDVRPLVQVALEMSEGIAEERGISIHVDMPEDLPSVNGASNLLQQVMSNLLGNAIKYNRDGGDVWVEADGDDDVVTMTFRDNGLGISEEDLPFIFDQFFRAANGAERSITGSGLGLAIVKLIVERHEGEIEAESEIGEGTQFTLRLPVS